ncbi:MAG TPA: site-2 protease family protein [Methanofastidiosum sp.]|nr:site-2 protease family protein [Methanofastidiosum sp.]HNU60595.1 site-2 protease family protein [Methanofastidiosum sp.]
MPWSLKFGSIFGIPIELHITFLLLLLIFSIFGFIPLLVIVLLFASVLVHELAHSLVGRHYGAKIKKITLLPIGGVSQMEAIPKGHEFAIAVIGPVTSITLGIVLFLFGSLFGLNMYFDLNWVELTSLKDIVRIVMSLNFLLGLFNIIPAFPMDGGRVLRAFLATKMDYLKATEISVRIGQGLAIVFAFVGILYNPWLIIIAFFIYMGGMGEYQSTQMSSALKGIKVKDLMVKDVVTVSPHDTLEDFEKLLIEKRHKGYPVVFDGNLLGIITINELLSVPRIKWIDTKVQDVMMKDIIIASPKMEVFELHNKLTEKNLGRAPVLENGKLIGFISKTDILKFSEILMLKRM